MYVLIDRVKLERIISGLEQGGSLSSYSDDIDNNVVSVLRANNSNLFGLDYHDSRTIYFSTTLTKGNCTLTSGYLNVIREKIEHIIDLGITADTVSMLSFQRGVNNKVLSNDGDGQGTSDNDRKGYASLIGCTTADDVIKVLRNGGCDLNTAMNYMAAMGISVADAARVVHDYSTYADGLPESPKDIAAWRNTVVDAYKNKIDENAEYRDEIRAKNESTVLDKFGNPKAVSEKQDDGSMTVQWQNPNGTQQSATIQKLSYPEGATAEEKAAIDKINQAMENMFLGGDITSNKMDENFNMLDALSTYNYQFGGSDFAEYNGQSDCSGLVGFMLSQITGDASCETIYTGDLAWGGLSDKIEGMNNYSYTNGVDTPVRVGDAVSYRNGNSGHTEMVIAVYEDGSYDTINLGGSPGVTTNHYHSGDWGSWTAITRYDGIVS